LSGRNAVSLEKMGTAANTLNNKQDRLKLLVNLNMQFVLYVAFHL